MEWYVVQTQELHGIFSSLGTPIGDKYQIGENCLASLGQIFACLATEDRTIRNFRRAIGVAQVIQTDLIPLLIHAKDDLEIMDATIRVLVNLSLPVECLLPQDILSRTECGRQTISDLNHLLISAKEAFVEPRATMCLVQRMRSAIDKGGKLTSEECESIGNCLLLLRNILHIPDNENIRLHGKSGHSPLDLTGSGVLTTSSRQNLILWNLFAQNVDKVLLHLMTCPQRAEWEVPMVQLVALTFKDQHMASLLKMLHLWLETSMSSESSEDNESNTSPQPPDSENSSPVLTSEATSDSSDNGGTAGEGGKVQHKSDRTKGMSPEKEHGGCVTEEKTVDFPDERRHTQTSRQSPKSDVATKVESIEVADNGIEDDRRKVNGDIKDEVKNEGEDCEGNMGDDEDAVSGDKDSGVFSQAASHHQSSPGERKAHSPAYQRNHYHHHHAHHYTHHHRPHAFQHLINKKDSLSYTPNNTPSSSKGAAAQTSELSDCGYSTQVENQPESLSTSSNEDEGPIAKRSMKPGHQKHHTLRSHHKVDLKSLANASLGHPVKPKSELRRKRLVKRSRSHGANIKVLLHHIPTDDDISNILKEFTLDFLLQGYGPLVSGLHLKLLSSCSHKTLGIHSCAPPVFIRSGTSVFPSPSTIFDLPSPELPPPPIDTSHFFWLITFFLRFSSQLELELEHISMVLSYDILSYLVFEGVGLCEELELAMHHCHESDIKPCLRRIHLVVTAIREFVQAVESYEKMAMTVPGREGDRPYLQKLQKQMASTKDLRCLFVLLLQHYNPSVMSKQYLQDIVVTNHVLLLFLEGGGGGNDAANNRIMKNNVRRNSLLGEAEMMEHIKQFANGSIVQQYGHLLEAFQENGEFVNDCVFTMLHHIGGGEVNRPETLFQPTLLRAFSAMWEADFDILDDWSDLIEYIIYKFISNPQQGMNQNKIGMGKGSLNMPGVIIGSKDKNVGEFKSSWTMEDLRNLRWFYAQSCKNKNVLGNIVNLYRQKSGSVKTRKEILKKLLSQRIIDSAQYASLSSLELYEDATDDFSTSFSQIDVMNISEKFGEIETWDVTEKDVAKIAVHLVKEGLEREVHWLQDALLEACYVKLNMKKQRERLQQDCPHNLVMEPVPYHYALMGQPIPIVPWGVEEQCAVIQNACFGQLLNCLGIQKPREDGIGGIYPRIPNSFTPLELLEAAKKLGELNPGKLKFDPAELDPVEIGVAEQNGERVKMPPPLCPLIVRRSNSLFQIQPSDKFPCNRLFSQPDSSGSKNNSSDTNILATATSNFNWLNIVARSKSPTSPAKQSLKEDDIIRMQEDRSKGKKQMEIQSNCEK